MTKIINITPTPKEYSDTGLFKESAETFSVNNTGTQRVTLSDIASDNTLFTVGTIQANVEPSMPINSTLYFVNANKAVQNSDGSFATTWQGYGAFCTTDALGIPTIGFTSSYIEIDSVNNGVNMELVGMYTDGVKYFFGTNGEVVAEGDPDATDIFYGTGNSDGFIDVDIKTIPQIEVLGYIDGEYVVNIKGVKTIID